MGDKEISCDVNSVRELREEEEEDFCSCFEDDEVWKEAEEPTKEEQRKYVLDEFSVKLFFKGISMNGVGESSSGLSGIGVVMERSAGHPVIQVQKKLDFYVEESVADYLALMDGMVEALENNILHVYAFTDSEILQDQVSLLLAYIGSELVDLWAHNLFWVNICSQNWQVISFANYELQSMSLDSLDGPAIALFLLMEVLIIGLGNISWTGDDRF